MMSAAHGQAVLVRECGEIMRMRRVHDEPNQGAALFLWTKDADSGQFSETLTRVTRKLRIMFKNCRASDALDVINCRGEPDRAGNTGRTGFKPLRRFLKC